MVKRGEESRLFLFLALFLLLIMGTEVGSGVSMSLFLTNAGADKLPLMFLMAAVLNFFVVVTYMFLTSRMSNKSIFFVLLGVSSIILLITRLSLPYSPKISSYILYAMFEFLFSSINLHFSVYIADYFDTRESKRLVPIIFSGARAGGIIGGVILTFLAPVVGSANIIFIWIAVLILAAGLLNIIDRKFPRQVFDYERTSKESTMFFRHVNSGLQFLKGSALLKSLAGGFFLLGLLSLIIKYLYSNIFVATFPGEDQLTAFYGMYIMVANILAFILQLTLTNRIIDSFGLGAANTIYAVGFTSGFLALVANYGFLSGIWARFSDEQLESVFQDPVEGLLYNAVPDHERARAKALSSGLIKPLSEISGSILLQLIKGVLTNHSIAIIGLMISGVYFAAVQIQNKGYVDGLMKMVKDNTLNLEDLANLRWEKASRNDLKALYALAESNDEIPRRGAVTLLLHLDEDIDFSRLTKGFFLWKPEIQEDFLRSYFKRKPVTDNEFLLKALRQTESNVKKLIIEFFIETQNEEGASIIAEFMEQDSDLQLQNNAIRYFLITEFSGKGAAERKLQSRLAADNEAVISANLSLILDLFDEKYIYYLLEKIHHKNRNIVIKAVNTLAEVYQTRGREYSEIREMMEQLIKTGAYHETKAAVKILGKRAGEREKEILIKLLDNPSPILSQLIIRILAENYPDNFPEYLKILNNPSLSLTLKENIILLIRELTNLQNHHLLELREILKNLIRGYFELVMEQDVLKNCSSQGCLLLELHERNKTHIRIMILKLLEILLHQKVVLSIEKALITKNPRLISNAMELFENLWDKKQAKRLISLLHPVEEKEDIASYPEFFGGEKLTADEILKKYLAPDNERWNICAALLLLKDFPQHVPEFNIDRFLSHDDFLVKEAAQSLMEITETKRGVSAGMLTTIEKVMFLQSAPLFKSLKMDELKVIADICREKYATPGEMIIERGEVGFTMFIIAEGEVEIFLPDNPPVRLTVLKETDFFGEMALFSSDVRSASCKTLTNVKLLCIEREHFLNLIYEKPDISVEIIKVLSDRIRRADQQK